MVQLSLALEAGGMPRNTIESELRLIYKLFEDQIGGWIIMNDSVVVRVKRKELGIHFYCVPVLHVKQ